MSSVIDITSRIDRDDTAGPGLEDRADVKDTSTPSVAGWYNLDTLELGYQRLEEEKERGLEQETDDMLAGRTDLYQTHYTSPALQQFQERADALVSDFLRKSSDPVEILEGAIHTYYMEAISNDPFTQEQRDYSLKKATSLISDLLKLDPYNAVAHQYQAEIFKVYKAA